MIIASLATEASKLLIKISCNSLLSTLEKSVPVNNSSTLITPCSLSTLSPHRHQKIHLIQTDLTDHITSSKASESGQNIEASGDPLIERTANDGLLRVFSNNINGSQMSLRGFEIAPDIDVTDDVGADIAALQETKKPWNAANKNKYNQQTQLKWPQGVRNIFSSAPWSYDERDFMAGGTLLSLHGKVIGRVVEAEADKWGRFCWTTLRGSCDEGILLINAYRTCHVKTDNPGPFTSFQMEYTGLRESGIKDPQPRFQILTDLTALIDQKREQGYRPIVV
jgi:hypothetical protein